MRLTAALVLLILALPAAAAQATTPVQATMSIVVAEDASETMSLSFEGLRRLTQYHGICLPEGARESRVHDELGDVAYEAEEQDGRRSLSFVARGESLTIEMSRAAPVSDEHPLHRNDVNFCVPSGSRVAVEVEVPDAHTLFFVSDGGDIADARHGRVESDGPTHVFYAYEAPLDAASGLEMLVEGPFRVFAPATRVEQAREVARLSVAPFERAAEEAGLELPFDALRVLFVEETEFDWEAGHYNGNGYVTVKVETLAPDATEGYPYAGVKVLVHEAFHAVSFPFGRGDVEDVVAWWLEGTARHAERQVDVTMPNATRHCERSATEVRCWDFDDRIRRADLERAYDPGFAFEGDWEPSLEQSDDTRKFYYAYSDFLVATYIERYGGDAYRAAWDAMEAAFEDGTGCPCAEGWLEATLAEAAAGATETEIFLPYADLRAKDPAAFSVKVTPFVKDEDALQRELERQASPLAGIPAPWWLGLAALALVAVSTRARR